MLQQEHGAHINIIEQKIDDSATCGRLGQEAGPGLADQGPTDAA